jgi:hypothetical protein
MSNAANAALAEPWKDLWNGELSLTEKIIAEYWANADSLLFFQQLGVREVPALGGFGS